MAGDLLLHSSHDNSEVNRDVSHSMTTTTHQGHFAFDMGSGNEGLMPPTSLLRDENAHGHVQVPRSILLGVSSICSMLCLTVMCFSD